ncbi:MAG TPA: hypothetical protein VFO65_11780, partial [Acidimicrobiales bacterium]|nr:hypothetical protein [Acidimicrobiales bacterium]
DFWKAGLFYGGGTDQLVSQAIGVLAVGAFVAVAATIMFTAIKALMGLRVSEEEELAGLDILEHGAPGYGPDVSPPAPSRRVDVTVPASGLTV